MSVMIRSCCQSTNTRRDYHDDRQRAQGGKGTDRPGGGSGVVMYPRESERCPKLLFFVSVKEPTRNVHPIMFETDCSSLVQGDDLVGD